MSSRSVNKMDQKQSPSPRGPPLQAMHDPSNRKETPAHLKSIVTGVGKPKKAAISSSNTKRKSIDPPAVTMDIGAKAESTKEKADVAPTAAMAALAISSNTKTEVDATAGEEDYSELVPASAKTEHKTIDFNAESAEMDRIFEEQAAGQLMDLPKFQRPKRFKKNVKLFEHQKDGIRWLIQQERNPRSNPFSYTRILKNGTVAGYDKFTKRRLATEGHAPVRGSILADEMGLGKTLQTLGLIMSNPPSGTFYGTPTHHSSDSDDDSDDEDDCTVAKTTLIVCPKSVISNFETQIAEHVRPNTFKVKKYAGTRAARSKIIDLVEEDAVDILLASYEIIASEFSKKVEGKKGVHDIRWWRIVLDEAHHIRNPSSKAFKAVAELSRTNSLALTGSPFVNNPQDIYALLSFVGLQPLDDKDAFKIHILDMIQERRRCGLYRLRAALAYSALRRTKNAVNLEMVEKTVHVSKVEFTEGFHKEIHDCLYFAAKTACDASINGVGRGYSENGPNVSSLVQQSAFEMLLRVRQSCCYGQLVPYERYNRAKTAMEKLRDDNGDIKQLTALEGNGMIDFLMQASGSLEGEGYPADLGVSPKIQALLDQIEDMTAGEKGVVFSQWTGMLDAIEPFLTQAGYAFVRIDGSMSSDQRTDALMKLTYDDDVRLILCSLKAAGVGINLQRANVAFMMDPWWNEAIENQAMDRIHRMGQTRPCRVYRFVMKDTVEDRMISIVQKGKAMLGKGTMIKLTKEEEKFAKITTLKDLFQIKEGDLNDDAFMDDSEIWR